MGKAMFRLVKGKDAGGLRWFLDGEPVHSGAELNLLVADRWRWSESRDDHVPAETRWISVRMEFDFFAARAIICWAIPGGVLEATCPEDAYFRWPPKGGGVRP